MLELCVIYTGKWEASILFQIWSRPLFTWKFSRMTTTSP